MLIKPNPEQTSGRWEVAAYLFCILFGTAHILNLHPIGDGLWFWYARKFREGSRLYADLHLNLQPFFVLVTALFQKLLGVGWIASKAPAFLQLLLFPLALVLISRYVPLRGWQRAILIVSVFVMMLAASWARFDDFHVVTHCFVAFSIYVLLRHHNRAKDSSGWLIALALGVMAGLSLVNRLNDGASLLTANLIALPLFVRRNHFGVIAAYLAAAVASVLLVIRLTGDTVSTWSAESIFHAAAIKGGTGPIVLQLVVLPINVFTLDMKPFGRINAMITACVLYAMYVAWTKRSGLKGWRLGGVIAGALILLALVPLFVESSIRGRVDMTVGVLGILLAYPLIFFVVSNTVWHLLKDGIAGVNPLPLLLIFPFGQLLGASMTSGRLVPEHTPAIGMMLLLLPIAYPWFAEGLPRVGLVTLASLLIVAGLPPKILHPYYWHHYDSAQMFQNREWYHHPVYGPMLIDRGQQQLMTSFCSIVQSSGEGSSQLLALPYPYPNYFCGIAPWHGYVQTWYDTSSAQTIAHLDQELDTAPPRWIMYQRGLDTMRTHERGYNGKQQLPHRDLDHLIMQKILTRQWALVKRQCFDGADWLLIRTTPATPNENDYPVMSTDKINLCERTANNYLIASY